MALELLHPVATVATTGVHQPLHPRRSRLTSISQSLVNVVTQETAASHFAASRFGIQGGEEVVRQ